MTQFHSLATELVIDNVSMKRGQNLLFASLSMTLKPSQIIWVQGPNGIGKSSLLHLAAGLVRPDHGHVKWTSQTLSVKPATLIGFQGHQDSLKPRLTAWEELRFWQRIGKFEGSIESILNQVGLAGKANIKIGSLSAGQKRRLALARLILSQKPIWIMDEPLAAMDDLGINIVNTLISNHINNGGSALIASHRPAEKLSDDTRILSLKVSPTLDGHIA